MAQRLRTFFASAVLIAASTALAQPTQTQPARESESDGLPAILIDAQLIARPVTITAIDDTSVSYRDEQGREKRAPAAGLAALLPRDPAPSTQRPAPPAPGAPSQSQPTIQAGTLLLTDGQRFPGKLTPSSGDPDAVSWTHPTFGLITIPLDNVARLRQPAKLEPDGTARPNAAVSASSDSEDQLFLVNGDRLSGFLAGLGNPVQIEVNGDTLSIPPDRVAAAALSNPRAEPKGLTVWLADGTVAALQRASSAAAPAPLQGNAKPAPQASIPTPQSRTTLTLTLAQSAAGATPGTYNLSDLRAVAFDIARLRPISSLPARAQRPLGERRFAAPMEMVNAETSDPLTLAAVGVPLDAYDLYFPGPMSVTLDLPERAERLAGEFELDPLAGVWADCDVVLFIDGGEAWRARLSRAGEPGAPNAAAFNLPIPALSAASANPTPRTLTIAIEPARFGPVMDRVYLRRGLVLLAK